MNAAGRVEVARYRVTAGVERAVIGAEMARLAFDAHPEHLRTGGRDGAFILWSLDHLGRRCSPIICKPVTAP